MNQPRRRLVDYLRYRIDNYFTRGPMSQLTLLVFITGVAALLGGIVGRLFLFSPSNTDVAGIGHKIDNGTADALWWSVMHFLDPSYVSQNYGASTPVVILSFILAFLGMVFFGSLIGFISADVERRFSELSQGNQPVSEAGHVLILGWNDKLLDLLDAFEGYHIKLRFVILSELSIDQMRELLRTGRDTQLRVKPVLRTGSPTNARELRRVAAPSARSIILLSDPNAADPDIGTVKTLMLLASHLRDVSPRPKIVAEVVDPHSVEVAKIACQGMASIVCTSEVVGRAIVQAARQQGLTSVYGQLFEFGRQEIFIRQVPGVAGHTFGELQFEFPRAILIGVSSRETSGGNVRYVPHINPGFGRIIGPEEWLILVAEDGATEHASGSPTPTFAPSPEANVREKAAHRVLVFGWNDKLYSILRGYDRFLGPGSVVTLVSHHSKEAAEALLLSGLAQPLENISCRCETADLAQPTALKAIFREPHSVCVVLEDESAGPQHKDARAITTLLLLQGSSQGSRPPSVRRIVAAVESTDTVSLLQEHPMTAHVDVVSPRIVSLILAQLSQQLMLENVYGDLMSAGATEIYLRPIGCYAAHSERCTFEQLMAAAAANGELAIGIRLASEAQNTNAGVRINPPRTVPLNLSPHDDVVVLARRVGN